MKYSWGDFNRDFSIVLDKGFSFDPEKGELVFQRHNAKISQVDNFYKKINLSKFLKELSYFLSYDAGYIDNLSIEGRMALGQDAGELISKESGKESKLRQSNMFEKRYTWSKKPEGRIEFEIVWEAKAGSPFSSDYKVYFTFNMVNRTLEEHKEMKDGKRVTLHSGKWELRNRYVVKCDKFKWLLKFKFIKNNPKLFFYLMKFLYKKEISEAIRILDENRIVKVQKFIHKFFDIADQH